MGTSALPPSDPPPTSPFSDWLNSDHLLTQALTRELSSPSCYSSSSSSSPALDSADFRSFLQSNHGALLHRPLAQVGSPVMSCNSISKEKSESPFNGSCVSAVSHLSSPATQSSSANQHFHREFDKLCNSIFNLSGENSSCITSLLSAAEAAAAAASTPLLSSARSLGAGATKVSKRRSSASKKAPIAVLSADASNFRDMVQQLTGIPTSHPAAPSLLKPQATRPGYNGAELPTLDTSACFLSPKQKLPFFQRERASLPFGLSSTGARSYGYGEGAPPSCAGRGNMGSHGTYNLLHPSWDHVGSAKSVGQLPLGNVRELLASNILKGGEQACLMQSSTLLERFLMSDDAQAQPQAQAQSPHINVDSWLALDGGALTNQSTIGLDVANFS